MIVPPPSRDELHRVGARLGLPLTPDEADAFVTLSERYLGAYDRVDELARRAAPSPRPRPTGRRPESAENPLGAWVWKGSIRERGSGPLSGYRVAIKDNIAVRGVPMLVGSEIMEGFEPTDDAAVVERVLDAGGEIVGKTAVPGFCFDGAHVTGYPPPKPVNPHERDHWPGGSSSGNAVALVAGDADVALGTDTAGSIRIPASWSGCCGLKPTYGLVPTTGIFPIELTLDHVGPMARTVADVALLLDVVADDGGARTAALREDVAGLAIGILREGFGIPGASEPDVDETVRTVARRFAECGASVVDASVPMHADGVALWAAILFEGATAQFGWGDAVGTNRRGRYSADIAEFFGRRRIELGEVLPPTVKLTLLLGQYVSDRTHHRYYAHAQNLSRSLVESYDDALARVDLLVLPTTPMRAFRKQEDAGIVEVVATAWSNLQNTAPFNLTGHPALSVPCGFVNGLPVGLMIVGRRNDDALVLRAGHALQALLEG